MLLIEDVSSSIKTIIHISIWASQEGNAIDSRIVTIRISAEDIASSLIGACLISLRIIIPAKHIARDLVRGVGDGAYIIEVIAEWGVIIGDWLMSEVIYIYGPIATEGHEIVAAIFEQIFIEALWVDAFL